MPIVDSGKLVRYKHIISGIQTSGTYLDEITPSKNKPVVSASYSEHKTMASQRQGVLGGNRDSWSSDPSHRNDADKNERQKQLLGRDYVYFYAYGASQTNR